VFNPISGAAGIAPITGITGGYLMVYPLVAALAGFVFERGARSFARAAVSAVLAEILLFAGGIGWLYVLTHSLARAAYLGLYWFIAAEVLKVMFAAAIAARWPRRSVVQP
jgi:biotin transport system substrate-specific component